MYADRQRDLAYWFEKAHAQGHPQTWLLLANCYASGKLMPHADRNAKQCFKRAVEHDSDGQAAFDYGQHLCQQQQLVRGWEMLTQAAEKGHAEALLVVQEKHYGTPAYAQWVSKGLESEQLAAYTLDAFQKLHAYTQLADDDRVDSVSDEQPSVPSLSPKQAAHKHLRSAVIVGTAKRAPGMAFIQAYVDGHGLGHKSLTQADMADKMVASYEDLPAFLPHQTLLFRVICAGEGHYEVLRKVYTRVLAQGDSEEAKADVKFQMAQKAIAEFKKTKSVATPDTIHNLLSEAADAGHKAARSYIHSAEGKALMKKSGYATAGRMQPKSAGQKVKDKKKRKLAKKARKQ